MSDPFFLHAGAAAFKRDIREAAARCFGASHCTLKTNAVEIAAAIRVFLPR